MPGGRFSAVAFSAAVGRRTECKSAGNRRELIAASDPLLTEATYEDPPHRGHKGAAAGEEDSIYFARLNAGAFQ